MFMEPVGGIFQSGPTIRLRKSALSSTIAAAKATTTDLNPSRSVSRNVCSK